HITTGIATGDNPYRHVSMDVRVAISLFTTIAVCMDDSATLTSIDCPNVHLDLCGGLDQKGSTDGLARELLRILRSMWNYYPKFGASAIFLSTMQFLNISLLDHNPRDIVLPGDSIKFTEYRRSLDRCSEAYAYFIWEKSRFPDPKVYMHTIPDAMNFVNYANDVLSFYKEVLAGDTQNYITERA
ncbi:hypothetical protein FOMPIDRAFT_31126, partial [Fomitopsis schrenkii]